MAKEKTTDEALERFALFLKRHSLKMTRERRLILREIFSSDDHFEAEDLLLRFRARKEKVSRATIYRTFDLLNKAELIKKSDFGENHYHYERSYGQEHHDHMICRRCGNVIEFSSPDIEALQEKIAKDYGFEMTSHTLQIFGYCVNCRQK